MEASKDKAKKEYKDFVQELLNNDESFSHEDNEKLDNTWNDETYKNNIKEKIKNVNDYDTYNLAYLIKDIKGPDDKELNKKIVYEIAKKLKEELESQKKSLDKLDVSKQLIDVLIGDEISNDRIKGILEMEEEKQKEELTNIMKKKFQEQIEEGEYIDYKKIINNNFDLNSEKERKIKKFMESLRKSSPYNEQISKTNPPPKPNFSKIKFIENEKGTLNLNYGGMFGKSSVRKINKLYNNMVKYNENLKGNLDIDQNIENSKNVILDILSKNKHFKSILTTGSISGIAGSMIMGGTTLLTGGIGAGVGLLGGYGVSKLITKFRSRKLKFGMDSSLKDIGKLKEKIKKQINDFLPAEQIKKVNGKKKDALLYVRNSLYWHCMNYFNLQIKKAMDGVNSFKDDFGNDDINSESYSQKMNNRVNNLN